MAGSLEVLTAAARLNGLDVTGSELIRDGSHAMYRLDDKIIARVGKPGSQSSAEREVRVSRWLTEQKYPVTQLSPGMLQPTVIKGQAVTWWRSIPQHRPATPAELGGLLRMLHSLPAPESLSLPSLNLFCKLAERIKNAVGINRKERDWLVGHYHELLERYHETRFYSGIRIIHGDAWQGNVAVPQDGSPILLDLEDVSRGHPEWDLISIAVDHVDFARIDAEEYQSFVGAYGGFDVTGSPGYGVLAAIQELRWVCFTLSKADNNPAALRETRHRISCLRGELTRPWKWTAF
ncbi:MAG: phosphotransferase family protein [Pseudonocardiaceae bacterium]